MDTPNLDRGSDLRSRLAALAGVDRDSELTTVGADILRRARWALAHNDGHPNGAWSPTEQLAVAWVLDDRVFLAEVDYTPAEAARQVAGGMYFPPDDMDAWLADLRTRLNVGG